MIALATTIFFGLTIFVSTASADEWTYYGGDQGGKHYSSASQITINNVDKLAVAWTYQSGDVKKIW
jgi:quinoprotein glucose dehydrogenase